MSRNGNKKPVGFGTHLIAGGIAGGCEAVCVYKCVGPTQYESLTAIRRFVVNMSTSGHYQGSDAAFEVGAYARGRFLSYLTFQHVLTLTTR